MAWEKSSKFIRQKACFGPIIRTIIALLNRLYSSFLNSAFFHVHCPKVFTIALSDLSYENDCSKCRELEVLQFLFRLTFSDCVSEL